MIYSLELDLLIIGNFKDGVSCFYFSNPDSSFLYLAVIYFDVAISIRPISLSCFKTELFLFFL